MIMLVTMEKYNQIAILKTNIVTSVHYNNRNKNNYNNDDKSNNNHN